MSKHSLGRGEGVKDGESHSRYRGSLCKSKKDVTEHKVVWEWRSSIWIKRNENYQFEKDGCQEKTET